MARARLTYLSAEDRDFVHEQAVRVLAEIGIGYNTPEAIELLADGRRRGRPDGADREAAVGARRALPRDVPRRRCGSRAATRVTTSSSETDR